ncbi:MAG: hypothetical protein WD904_03370 [Dehalococcoidia bacterium]
MLSFIPPETAHYRLRELYEDAVGTRSVRPRKDKERRPALPEYVIIRGKLTKFSDLNNGLLRL